MLLPFDSLMQTGRFDYEAARFYDRHYSRQTCGSPQYALPGELLSLRDSLGKVLFVWVKQKYRRDGRAGQLYCAIFRNETSRLSSDIILESERLACAKWGGGLAFTFIDPQQIRSSNPGYCFKVAGWNFVGKSKAGKHILEKVLRRTPMKPSEVAQHLRRITADVCGCAMVMDYARDGTLVPDVTHEQFIEISYRATMFLVGVKREAVAS